MGLMELMVKRQHCKGASLNRSPGLEKSSLNSCWDYQTRESCFSALSNQKISILNTAYVLANYDWWRVHAYLIVCFAISNTVFW